MNKKTTSLVYIGGSLLLVVVAIAITTILNRTSSPTTQGEDIRAKAGSTNTMQVKGVVSEVDAPGSKLKLDNVTFVSSDNSSNLGLWTVSAPQVDLSTLPVGSKVILTIDSATFLISAHTMTATQIKTTQ
jgi:hypothetical protein